MKKEIRDDIMKIKNMILNVKEDITIVCFGTNNSKIYEITLKREENHNTRSQKLEWLFNDKNIKEGLELAIKIKDNDKYRVCFIDISDKLIEHYDEEYASEIVEDVESEIGDTFESMFGKIETNLPTIKININSDKCCPEINNVIDLLSKSSDEISICALHKYGFIIDKNWDEDTRENHLYHYFFTNDSLKKGMTLLVEVIKSGKKRVCILYVDREQVIIYGKPITEKLIYKFRRIPKNVIIDTFENIFEKIEGKNVQRIEDISFINKNKEIEDSIDIEKYETIQELIEKLCKSQKVLDIDFFNKDNAYWMLSLNKDEDKTKRELAKYFKFFTNKELEDGIYLTIRTSVDNKEKQCEIIVKPEQIALLSAKIVRKHIKKEYEEEFYCNLDEIPRNEWDKDIKDAVENNPEEFENLFSCFNNDEIIVRIEEGEDGEWVLI